MMKSSFLNKLGLGPSKRNAPASEDVGLQLGAAQDLLHKLKAGHQDFPALNEATRLVQVLEGAVSRMVENENKSLWREQVSELQKELQIATERMLSDPPSDQPRQPADEPDAAGELFTGLSFEGQSSPSAAGVLPADSGDMPATSGDMPATSGDMFSGLTFAEPEPEQPAGPAAVPAVPSSPVAGGPLPEDLFSGLDDISIPSPSTSGQLPPTPAATPTPPPANPLEAELGFLADLSGTPYEPDPLAQPDPFLPSDREPSPNPSISSQGFSREASVPGAPNSAELAQAAAAQPATAQKLPAGGVKKKRVTRRIGYDRADAGEPAVKSVPLSEVLAASRAQQATEGQQRVSRPQGESLPRDVLPAAAPTSASASASPPAACAASPSFPPAQLLDFSLHAAPAPPPQLPRKRSRSFDADAIAQAMEGQSVAAVSDALREAAKSALTHAHTDAEAAAAAERAAKAGRRSLLAEIGSANGSVQKLQAEEAAAVEAEDFEAAATCSAQLDEVKQQMRAAEAQLRAADDAAAQLAGERERVVQGQAAMWRSAARALTQLHAQHAQRAQRAQSDAQQAERKAQEARTAAAEHVQELGSRIEQRRRWLEDESAAVQKKVADAQAPVVAEQQERAQARDAVAAIVARLRAQLAEQEELLEAAEEALAESDEAMAAAASRYSKTLARLEEDRAALTADEAERDAESAAAESAAAESSHSCQVAQDQTQLHLQEASQAEEAAAEMVGKAVQLSAALEAQGRSRALQEKLRQEQTDAEAQLQEARQALEAAEAVAKETGARVKALRAAAGSAQELAAASRRRVVALEADKKAAAAAREFKEAARLAAEAKACAAQAQDSDDRAAEAGREAAGLERERAEQEAAVDDQRDVIATAQRSVAHAQWHRLQLQADETSAALETATAAEDFEEAAALQEELQAVQRQAAALQAAHSFPEPSPEAAMGSSTDACTGTDLRRQLQAADRQASTAAASTSRFATDGSESVRSALSASAFEEAASDRISRGPGSFASVDRLSDTGQPLSQAIPDAHTDSPRSTASSSFSHLPTPSKPSQLQRDSSTTLGTPLEATGYLADSDSTVATGLADLDDAQPPGSYARASLPGKQLPALRAQHSSGSVSHGLLRHADVSAEVSVPPDSASKAVKFAAEVTQAEEGSVPSSLASCASLPIPTRLPAHLPQLSGGNLERTSFSTAATKGSPTASDISARSFLSAAQHAPDSEQQQQLGDTVGTFDGVSDAATSEAAEYTAEGIAGSAGQTQTTADESALQPQDGRSIEAILQGLDDGQSSGSETAESLGERPQQLDTYPNDNPMQIDVLKAQDSGDVLPDRGDEGASDMFAGLSMG